MAVRATPYIECLDGKILSESFFKSISLLVVIAIANKEVVTERR